MNGSTCEIEQQSVMKHMGMLANYVPVKMFLEEILTKLSNVFFG